MKQTTAAKLLAKFEKLNKFFVTGDGKPITPTWLQNIMEFLQENYHKTADMHWLAKNWENDNRCTNSLNVIMKLANDTYKDLTISNKNK